MSEEKIYLRSKVHSLVVEWDCEFNSHLPNYMYLHTTPMYEI